MALDQEESKPKERVVDQILEQLTPENIQKQIQEIETIALPQELNDWINEYEKIGKRNKDIWKRIYSMMPLITLPIVSENYKESIIQTKSLFLIVFAVLLNDVADTTQNDILLNELLKIPFKEQKINFESLSQSEKEYFLFTEKLWNYVESVLQQYPKYEEFKKFLSFDIHQILISNEHDYLITNNYHFNNEKENWLYPSYTMGGMACGDIDLMSSKNFNVKNLGLLREITWHAQRMARIGNWISTWEREIYENDFTSKVILDAINCEIVTIEELKSEDKNYKKKIIDKIKNSEIEKKLLKEWEISHDNIAHIGIKIDNFEVNGFLNNLKKLLFLELSSKI
jgi:hypothetical protein